MDNITTPLSNLSTSEEGILERVIVPILDSIILVTGILGHSLVILILSRKQRGHGAGGAANGSGPVVGGGQATDTLLLSLSAADLILLACLPFHTVAIAMGHWQFGSAACKLMGFLGAVCTSASAFTLAALATARYLIVVRPSMAYRWCRDARRIKLATAALWVPAVILAAPQFTWRTLDSSSNIVRKRSEDLVCFNFLSPEDQVAYGVCHFLLAFALPLGIIAVAYGRIYVFLRQTRQRQTTMDRLERYQNQVTKTSALLVLAFTLCWLPSYAFMFAQLAADTTVTNISPRYGGFATFARVMATSATVANPILYSFMSKKFRKELRELGQWSCKGCSV